MSDFGRTILIISTCLSITACGFWGGQRNTASITPASIVEHKRDYWFCHANEAGDDWDCVHDSRLAMEPIPARNLKLQQPELAPVVALDLPMPPAPLQVATDLTNADPADVKVRATAPAPLPEPVPLPEPAPLPKPAPVLARTPLSVELHDWLRFNYRPSASIALSELPAHFYTVQIVAMSSMEALESFIKEHRQSDVLAARVEANGEFYYVLLLGIYETLASAKAAAASRSESLMNIEPWVRKLGSLQGAVARADELADSSRPAEAGRDSQEDSS